MIRYFHKFEVRWSDIDANRHLANFAYMHYTAQTRMAFMNKHKMGLSQLGRWGISPVILNEKYSFFKEIYAESQVYVSLEITGVSEDASIYEFVHHFYLPDGTHCASSKILGVWIDVMLRKRTSPPDEILLAFNEYKTPETRLLTIEDVKKEGFAPQNIDPKIFEPKKWTKII